MKSRILLIAPSWIGDMVMAQPLLATLRRERQVTVDVLALPWIKPLLSRMPGVDGVLDMPVGHGKLGLRERYRIGRSLRGCYSQAVILPNTLKSALIPWFARIPKRTGYTGEARYGFLNDRRRADRTKRRRLVAQYTALAYDDGDVTTTPACAYPKLNVTDEQRRRTCRALGVAAPDRAVLGLCPGAEFGAAKRWPAEHYAQVAKYALQRRYAVWLFGAGADQTVTREINALCDDACLDLAGKTTLEQAIDLLSITQIVITNDSGLMHVACALGKRVIALFGSSSADYTPPLSDTATALSLNLDCSPCFQRDCPLGHTHCLRLLLPERVIEALA